MVRQLVSGVLFRDAFRYRITALEAYGTSGGNAGLERATEYAVGGK